MQEIKLVRSNKDIKLVSSHSQEAEEAAMQEPEAVCSRISSVALATKAAAQTDRERGVVEVPPASSMISNKACSHCWMAEDRWQRFHILLSRSSQAAVAAELRAMIPSGPRLARHRPNQLATTLAV